jgi:hypothetical protein
MVKKHLRLDSIQQRPMGFEESCEVRKEHAIECIQHKTQSQRPDVRKELSIECIHTEHSPKKA